MPCARAVLHPNAECQDVLDCDASSDLSLSYSCRSNMIFGSHMLHRVQEIPQPLSGVKLSLRLDSGQCVVVMSSSDESPQEHAQSKMATAPAASSSMRASPSDRGFKTNVGKKRAVRKKPAGARAPKRGPASADVISVSTSRSTSSSNSSASSSDSAPSKKRKLRVGTDFSGLETLCHILKRAQIKHRLMFATEKQQHLRKFIKKRFAPRWVGPDAMEHIRKCTVDLYAAGPPCQPWSRVGRQQGLADEKGRGMLVYGPIEYIEQMQQRVAILENVSSLCTDFADVFNDILRRLRQAGYRVHFENLNTIDHGLPQSRPRIYIVCIKRKRMVHKFEFPKKTRLEDSGGRVARFEEEEGRCFPALQRAPEPPHQQGGRSSTGGFTLWLSLSVPSSLS